MEDNTDRQGHIMPIRSPTCSAAPPSNSPNYRLEKGTTG